MTRFRRWLTELLCGIGLHAWYQKHPGSDFWFCTYCEAWDVDEH